MRDIDIVPEDAQFGLMTWRLLSREIDEQGHASTIVKALPIMGLGVYVRTIHRVPGRDEYVFEEPMLLKNTLMVELMEMQDSGLVNVAQQPVGIKYKCINREVITLDEGRRRFAPKGPKSMPPGIEIYAGAILTQERRPMPAMANIIGRGKPPLAAVPPEEQPPPADVPPAEAPSTP